MEDRDLVVCVAELEPFIGGFLMQALRRVPFGTWSATPLESGSLNLTRGIEVSVCDVRCI